MKPTLMIAPELGEYVNPGFNYYVQADLTSIPCGNGSWNNSPTSYTYRWLRTNGSTADPGEVPGNNPTLNDAIYNVTQEDVGYCLRCEVTAINADGSTTALSNMTSFVQGKPKCLSGPVVTPTAGGISGPTVGTLNAPGIPTTFTVGSVWYFSGLSGVASGMNFVWKLANPDGSILNLLAGGIQGNAEYICTPEDIGKRLYCEVTMANALGATTVISNMTDVLVQAPPIRYFGVSVNSTMPGNPVIEGWYDFSGKPPVIPPPLMPTDFPPSPMPPPSSPPPPPGP